VCKHYFCHQTEKPKVFWHIKTRHKGYETNKKTNKTTSDSTVIQNSLARKDAPPHVLPAHREKKSLKCSLSSLQTDTDYEGLHCKQFKSIVDMCDSWFDPHEATLSAASTALSLRKHILHNNHATSIIREEQAAFQVRSCVGQFFCTWKQSQRNA